MDGSAKMQRGVMPSAIQQIHHRGREARHLGNVLAVIVDGFWQLVQHFGAINAVVDEGDGNVTLSVGHPVIEPVRTLDVVVGFGARVGVGLLKGSSRVRTFGTVRG